MPMPMKTERGAGQTIKSGYAYIILSCIVTHSKRSCSKLSPFSALWKSSHMLAYAYRTRTRCNNDSNYAHIKRQHVLVCASMLAIGKKTAPNDCAICRLPNRTVKFFWLCVLVSVCACLVVSECALIYPHSWINARTTEGELCYPPIERTQVINSPWKCAGNDTLYVCAQRTRFSGIRTVFGGRLLSACTHIVAHA